ncbi:MAG: hypothetical protein H0X40_10575 [Chthoniobacterales bacterium]|nr:hypothetical protein [Chthoniobacterales bacterium]
MKKTYYPDDISGQISWWSNVQNEASTYLPQVGFNPGEVSDVLNDAGWAVYLLQIARAQASNFASTIFGFVDSALKGGPDTMTLPSWPSWMPSVPAGPLHGGIDTRRVGWVKQVTGAPQYTPDVIGAAMRLTPTGTPFDPNTYTGEIVNAKAVGHEQVKFTVRLAQGNIDGGNLYLQRNGDSQPTFVRFFSMRTFIDTTPLKVANVPEVRTYTYWPVINDEQVGQISQSTQVTVS